MRVRLEDAVGTGELIGIFYHGGSQAGAYREIRPLELLDVAVRANCHTSKSTKHFRLAQIELADPDDAAANAAEIWREPLVMPDATDMVEIERLYRDRVEAAGWTVIITSDDNGDTFNLHSKFKNGKLRKHPTYPLAFRVHDGRPLAKPWQFHGWTWKNSGRSGRCCSARPTLLRRSRAPAVKP